MDRTSADPVARLRLLESWLPLAQAERERYGWSDDGPALEQLILRAAPALSQAHSLLAARALLWHYHDHGEREEPWAAARGGAWTTSGRPS
jgi:hypothetical protein